MTVKQRIAALGFGLSVAHYGIFTLKITYGICSGLGCDNTSSEVITGLWRILGFPLFEPANYFGLPTGVTLGRIFGFWAFLINSMAFGFGTALFVEGGRKIIGRFRGMRGGS